MRADCSKHPLYHEILDPAMIWLRCASCGHLYTDGHMSDEACERIFSTTHANQQVGHKLEAYRMISAKMIERVLPFQSEGMWLDVGFGNGALLMTAQEYGFTPVGLDLRRDNVRRLDALGVKAFANDISELEGEAIYAVISMADVLEHIPYPKDALIAARRLLVDGGALFLSMPNAGSLLWQLASARNSNP